MSANAAAFLRGVNVGRRAVAMADLRVCVTSLGYEDVGTILQSGTVLFRAGRASAVRIETELERALLAKLSLETTVCVRSAAQIEAIVQGNPFDRMASDDPSHLVAVVLKAQPSAAAVAAFKRAIAGREQISLGEGVLYVTYPDGIGESKLTAAVLDRALGTVGTARNWNTVRRIAAALTKTS